MLEEDRCGTQSSLANVVFQQEDLEVYLVQHKNRVTGWTEQLQKAYESNSVNLNDFIVKNECQSLINNLIQELQQFILCNDTGTTDQSVFKSDSLERIQSNLDEGVSSIKQSLTDIVSFAKTNLGLALSVE